MDKSILVGDIGSTKSTWWYYSGEPTAIHLSGYNPVVHAIESGTQLFDSLRSKTSGIAFSDIWYYGTGVLDQHVAGKVRHSLQQTFPGSHVHVSSDLAGAAIASCGHDEGTVAILGTGSHAAVWDGKKIARQAVSLGYILGDEGGGCDIGKALIQAYFYNDMPQVIAEEMAMSLPSGRTGLLNNLLTSATPNQYLAEFVRVAVLFQEHFWIKELVSSRFKLFVNRHLNPLDPPGVVHIVGSIGCIFASLIKQELEKSGLTVGTFIKDPALRLFDRHLEYG